MQAIFGHLVGLLGNKQLKGTIEGVVATLKTVGLLRGVLREGLRLQQEEE